MMRLRGCDGHIRKPRVRAGAVVRRPIFVINYMFLLIFFNNISGSEGSQRSLCLRQENFFVEELSARLAPRLSHSG